MTIKVNNFTQICASQFVSHCCGRVKIDKKQDIKMKKYQYFWAVAGWDYHWRKQYCKGIIKGFDD
jgi:hypothetical protein